MNAVKKGTPVAQFAFRGLDVAHLAPARASCQDVAPGQEVRYMGRALNGPRHGARGVVTKALRRRAIVDMGPAGTWHIPYYFLGLLPRAS